MEPDPGAELPLSKVWTDSRRDAYLADVGDADPPATQFRQRF